MLRHLTVVILTFVSDQKPFRNLRKVCTPSPDKCTCTQTNFYIHSHGLYLSSILSMNPSKESIYQYKKQNITVLDDLLCFFFMLRMYLFISAGFLAFYFVLFQQDLESDFNRFLLCYSISYLYSILHFLIFIFLCYFGICIFRDHCKSISLLTREGV